MAYDTTLLDQAVSRRLQHRERQRQQTLRKVRHFLDDKGRQYGLDQAIIFGSLLKPGRFHERSDVDVAVSNMTAEKFFDLMSALSLALGRDVDLVDLAKCHFADQILESGERWMRKG